MERAPVLCQNLNPHPPLRHFPLPFTCLNVTSWRFFFFHNWRGEVTRQLKHSLCAGASGFYSAEIFQPRFATDLAHRLPHNKTLNKPTVQSDYLNHFIWMNTHTKNMASNPSSNRKIVWAKPCKQKLCWRLGWMFGSWFYCWPACFLPDGVWLIFLLPSTRPGICYYYQE